MIIDEIPDNMLAEKLTEHQVKRLRRVILDKLNRKRLPAFWRTLGDFGPCGIALEKLGVLGGQVFTVLAEVEEHAGIDWWHISAHGKPDRCPTWDELVEVRDALLGPQAMMIQVIPPRSEHYSLNNTLHMWARVDGTPLVPDLRKRSHVDGSPQL